MFGLFKKNESKAKVDAAELERQEREQRRRELADKLREEVKSGVPFCSPRPCAWLPATQGAPNRWNASR